MLEGYFIVDVQTYKCGYIHKQKLVKREKQNLLFLHTLFINQHHSHILYLQFVV